MKASLDSDACQTLAPRSSSEQASRRMRAVRQRMTAPEIMLREQLKALGIEFEMHVAVSDKSRSRADFVIRAARLVIFVDGCFWHGCPIHGTTPKSNTDWWEGKLRGNRERDSQAEATLRTAGWTVLRFWTHTSAAEAIDVIRGILVAQSATPL